MRTLTRAMVAAGLLAALSGPIAFGAEPTTQPSRGKVAVLPFTATNPADPSQAALGQSIRQGILSDLMPYAPGRVNALEQRADDEQAAIDAARKAGAAYVVIGSVVTVGPEVRFDGQVIDVDSGKAVAPLKVTGPAEDLFGIQNALARQLGAAIGLALPAPTPPSTLASAGPNASGSDVYLTGPAANPYAPSFGGADTTGGSNFNNYGYGPWGYWPYWPIFITAGKGHGGHVFNRAFNGPLPFGLFIPTNRAQSLAYNRFGGSGTINIAGPFAPRAAGGRGAGGRAVGTK